jgi:hypothetical protein
VHVKKTFDRTLLFQHYKDFVNYLPLISWCRVCYFQSSIESFSFFIESLLTWFWFGCIARRWICYQRIGICYVAWLVASLALGFVDYCRVSRVTSHLDDARHIHLGCGVFQDTRYRSDLTNTSLLGFLQRSCHVLWYLHFFFVASEWCLFLIGNYRLSWLQWLRTLEILGGSEHLG